MKHFIQCTCSAVVIGTLVAGLAFASEKSDSKKVDPKMEEMMKRMEAASKVGAEHKALDSLVGDWNAEVKMWMDRSAPPNVSKGIAKRTWILGNRFVQEEFKGEFMGKPFHGMGLTGYDNMKKKYNNFWVDDVSTAMFTNEGTAEKGGKTITFEGKYDCAMTGEKDKPSKQIVRILSRDKHVFEMYDPSKGENAKMMEITYTRK